MINIVKLKIIGSKILNLFFAGLLLIVPLSLCVYIIYKTFTVIDSLLPHDGILQPIYFPGLGVILVLLCITLVGFAFTKLIRFPINEFLDKNIEKLPVISMIYTSARDLMKAFVGEEKRFNKPVLVCMSKENEIYKLGFITQATLEDLDLPDYLTTVYFPHSYNFSGELYIVSVHNITPLKADSGDLMKFIVSGGVTDLEDTNAKKNLKKRQE